MIFNILMKCLSGDWFASEQIIRYMYDDCMRELETKYKPLRLHLSKRYTKDTDRPKCYFNCPMCIEHKYFLHRKINECKYNRRYMIIMSAGSGVIDKDAIDFYYRIFDKVIKGGGKKEPIKKYYFDVSNQVYKERDMMQGWVNI